MSHTGATSTAMRVTTTPWRRFYDCITTFRFLIGTVLVAVVFWQSHLTIVDPDIWWHFNNARHLVTTHHFVAHDMWSYTVKGEPYLSYEWFPELLYYGAYVGAGFRGTYLFSASILSALVLIVFYLSIREGKDPLIAAVAAVMAVLLGSVGFGPRMHTIGWLLFAVMFAILCRCRYQRDFRQLWVLPPLFCLWINCHPSWSVGLFVFAVIIAAGMIRTDVGGMAASPWVPAELRRMVLVFGCACLALFVNPFGFRLVRYPVDAILRQRINMNIVDEWLPIDFSGLRGQIVLLVLALTFLAAVASRKRWRIDEVLLTLLVLFLGLSHIRFLILTGIVLPVTLAGKVEAISSYEEGKERRGLNAILIVVVILLLIKTLPGQGEIQKSIAVDYPTGAVEYLRAHPHTGHMFNLPQWGGFLEWNLPGVPTFIDGRLDVFEYRGVLRDYAKIQGFVDTEELLDQYSVDYVVYTSSSALAYVLARNPHWRQVYRDDLSTIIERVPGDGKR